MNQGKQVIKEGFYTATFVTAILSFFVILGAILIALLFSLFAGFDADIAFKKLGYEFTLFFSLGLFPLLYLLAIISAIRIFLKYNKAENKIEFRKKLRNLLLFVTVPTGIVMLILLSFKI